MLGVLLVGNISGSFAEIESVDVVENKMVTLIGEGRDSDTENLETIATSQLILMAPLKRLLKFVLILKRVAGKRLLLSKHVTQCI